PRPLIAVTLAESATELSENMSPPMPLVIGSTTLMAALVATAASKALPPCIKMRTPAIVASGWLLATIPLRDMTIERREKKRSPEMGGGLVMTARLILDMPLSLYS